MSANSNEDLFFLHWPDLLPELQHDMAMRHLDVFTRRALALTCWRHHAQWVDHSVAVIEPALTDLVVQTCHALGRWAPWRYIDTYCEKFAWEISKMEAVYAGMIREARDELALALLGTSENIPPLRQGDHYALDWEFGYILDAFMLYRTHVDFAAFATRANRSHRWPPIDSEALLRSGNIPWFFEYLRTLPPHMAVPFIDDNNIKYGMNSLLTCSRHHTYLDGVDSLPIQWSDVFQRAEGAQWLKVLHSKSETYVAFFYRNFGRCFVNGANWIRMWPYLLRSQQDDVREAVEHTFKYCSQFWVEHTRTALAIIETVGISVSPLEMNNFAVVHSRVWTDPNMLAILEHYWKAGRLEYDHYERELPDDLTLLKTFATSCQRSSLRQSRAALAWFQQHPFPGSDKICAVMQEAIQEKASV